MASLAELYKNKNQDCKIATDTRYLNQEQKIEEFSFMPSTKVKMSSPASRIEEVLKDATNNLKNAKLLPKIVGKMLGPVAI